MEEWIRQGMGKGRDTRTQEECLTGAIGESGRAEVGGIERVEGSVPE